MRTGHQLSVNPGRQRCRGNNQHYPFEIRSEGITLMGISVFRTAALMTFVIALPFWDGISGQIAAQERPSDETPIQRRVPDPEVMHPAPLNSQGTVLFDKPNGKLILKTTLCLRDGELEMLLCPKQTKEHESILTINASAQVIHAGLLALGAKPGHPVKFRPEYVPPQGQVIEIYLNWKDEDGKAVRTRAQDVIRHSIHRYFETPLKQLPEGVVLKRGDNQLIYDDVDKKLLFHGPMTVELKAGFLKLSKDTDFQKAVEQLFELGKSRPMEADFVFCGSSFAKLKNGNEVYQADAGSLICVANFGDAMIDINIASTASNDSGLLFEPWTERLPPVNTEVTVELIPAAEKPIGIPGALRTMQ
jgi:hypothetical protein